MPAPDLDTEQAVAAYRAELRTVGRRPRLIGFGFILLGAVLVWAAGQAGSVGPMVQWTGYGSLAAGWALMLTAMVLRSRYHRRRMAEHGRAGPAGADR